MLPIIEEHRKLITENLQKATQIAFDEAKRRAESAVNYHQAQLERMNTVADDYIKRGYHYLTGYQAPWVPGGRSTAPFVKALAKQLKRPYVSVCSEQSWFYDRNKGQGGSHHVVRFSFPNVKRLAPLYAAFMLAQDPGGIAELSVRRRMSSRLEWDVYGTNEAHHPLAQAWFEQVAHDPTWRKLLNIGVLPEVTQ